jgi:hypothetical protein
MRTMSRTALMLLGSISLFALGTPTAMASGSSTECIAAGGTYTKDGPNSICVLGPETKDVKGKALGTETTTTTTGQGNTGNKTQSDCTGNTGQCKQQ